MRLAPHAVAALAVALVFLAYHVHRIGRAVVVVDREQRETARDVQAARSTLAEATSSIGQRDQRLVDVERSLETCRVRTEHLRSVLDVLIPSGIWPERVRLPDAVPGWRPWPELGHRDRADGSKR